MITFYYGKCPRYQLDATGGFPQNPIGFLHDLFTMRFPTNPTMPLVNDHKAMSKSSSVAII
jgi:hypothetical protein